MDVSLADYTIIGGKKKKKKRKKKKKKGADASDIFEGLKPIKEIEEEKDDSRSRIVSVLQ